MEIKTNRATINRPEGDRVIDASYLYINIPSHIEQLKKEKAWKMNDRNGITIFKTESLALVLTGLHAGATIKDNCINGLVVLQPIEGKIRVNTVDGDLEMNPKDILTLRPNVAHSIEALTDAVILLSINE
jgi:quercetin dioxygenase-like cupin family protein